MNEPAALGFAVAFAAGLLSFLSPCVLPLVPSYVGFLTGMTLPEVGSRRRVALLHALMFVTGFSLVFILLGASATALGRALNYYQVWLQRVGGVLIIGFGLVCLGVFKSGWLTQERRLHVEHKPVGYLGSALVGMAFGAGLDALHRTGARRHPRARRHVGRPVTRDAAPGRLLRGTRRAVPPRGGGVGPVPGLVPALPAVPARG